MMKKIFAGILVCFAAISAVAVTYEKDKLLWKCNFSDTKEVGRLFGASVVKLLTQDGSLAIKGNKTYTAGVPANILAGKIIYIETEMSTEKIALPEKPYWGAKTMLVIKSKQSPTKYIEPRIPRYGTNKWAVYTRIFRVPKDAVEIQLWVGIQGSSGNFYIRNFKIYSCRESSGQVSIQNAIKPDTSKIPRGNFKGTKFRGFMTGRDLSEAAFKQLAAWHVNLIRYQMGAGKRDISTSDKYLAWIDYEIKKIDKILPLCKKYGIKLCLDLHTGPSGSKRNKQASNIITNPEKVISQLEQAWIKLASHYKNNPLIYGYDILNEPIGSRIVTGELHPWDAISEKIVKAIRKVDRKTPIIVEADQENWRRLHYIDDPNIIYSTHTYAPVEYTHQGVLDATPFTWKYPGVIQGKYWNKETLREDLKDIIVFQKKHNAKIYIGEFSVISWAQGNGQYLQDLTELFEEYGWDWTYHAYREFVGWSIEHESKNGKWVKSDNNPRRCVIIKALQKNKK